MPSRFDLVLAADCVYFEPAFPLLVYTLDALAMRDNGPEILFCYKKRRKVSASSAASAGLISLEVLTH